jgi:hypothetical protein
VNGLLARCAASLALLFSLLVASAAPALADCMMPPPVEQAVQRAEIAFVGTVMSVANGGRWATVAVDEIWVGPDLPSIISVRGGPEGNSATSVDRSFTAGTRYLFMPFIAEGTLQDNSCSSTTEFIADHAKLRPANARLPLASETVPLTSFDPMSMLLPVALVVGAGALVFGAALLLRRR